MSCQLQQQQGCYPIVVMCTDIVVLRFAHLHFVLQDFGHGSDTLSVPIHCDRIYIFGKQVVIFLLFEVTLNVFFFDDCDNFSISGCVVASGAVSAGYIFLNGKLRYFPGAIGITSWPQYIYELNSTESVPYESGDSKVGRNTYGCAIAKSVPVKQDE